MREIKRRFESGGSRKGSLYDPANWVKDPNHKDGVRPAVEKAFADLVQALNESPMAERVTLLDKGASDGYWGRIIERGARSFENYVISKLAQRGQQNDYLANVRSFAEWSKIGKNAERYPYLMPNEEAPVVAAFDSLFRTIEHKVGDDGKTVLFSRASNGTKQSASKRAGLPPVSQSVIDGLVAGLPGVRQAAGDARITTLFSPSELPSEVLDQARAEGIPENEIHGVLFNGRAYIVRQNLKTRQDVEEVLLHEVMGHGGVRALLGGSRVGVLLESFNRAGGVPGLRQIAKAYGVLGALNQRIPKGALDNAQKVALVDELLALAQGKNQKLRRVALEWVGKIRNFIIAALDKAGLHETAARLDKFDATETAKMLREMRDAVIAGGDIGGHGVAFMIAWHGSPHDHDGFDSSKIGTGEGAQAYGWGMYFAGAREVAEWYRERLSDNHGKVKLAFFSAGQRVEATPEVRAVASYITPTRQTQEAKVIAKRMFPNLSDAIDKVPDDIEVRNSAGRIYQVNLAPEQDEYLLWDKPLNEQPEKVREALKRGDFMDSVLHEYTGQQFYEGLVRDGVTFDGLTRQEAAKLTSEKLQSLGIRGIKYLDGNSRGAKEGSHNYVIFDDADIEITAKFSRSSSIKADYESRIDALFAGEKANRVGVVVLDKSDVLGLLGYADKPVVLQESKVLAGRDNHPRMTSEAWKKVPGWLDNPAAVFDSDTVSGRLVFIAPELVDGAPVLMIVEPQPSASGGTQMSVSLLVNAYDAPRGVPFMRWIGDGLTRFVDQKKFPAVFAQSVGRQLPNTALHNKPGMRRILTEKNLVGWRKENTTRNSAATSTSGTPAATIRAAIQKAYGKLLDRLEARGLVTLTQTQEEAIDAAAQARAAVTGERVEDVRKRVMASVKNSLSPMKSIDANVRRGREALAKALAEKTSVHRAMFRNDLGWVDFVWGDAGTVKPSGKTRGGMGLSHILEARQRKDGMTEVESVALLDSIVNAIASGSEFSRQIFLNTTRVGLEKSGVIVWLTKRSGSNAWVVTGYEKTSSDTDAGRATSVPTRTLASLTRSDAAEVSESIDDSGLDVKFSSNGDIEGFFDPASGKSFLIADALTEETAPGTLMHEVGIHMAAEKDGPMQKLITRAGKLRQKWANNKFVQEAEARMREAGETSDEEFLAYTVTQYENNRAGMPVTLVSLAKDFIAAVKAWMFNKGYLHTKNLTVADLAAIARANARKMARGIASGANAGATGVDTRQSVQRDNVNNKDVQFAANVLGRLSEEDEFFRHPVSQKTSLDGVFSDVYRDAEYFGEHTRTNERDATGADHRFVFQGHTGKTFYVYTTDDGKVWIDVLGLKPGDGGNAIYAAVANWAFNTGRKFQGDPVGVSPDATIRRTSNMLSSAIRFGTTKHLEPSPSQLKGDPENGVEPLKWGKNDAENIRNLIYTFQTTLYNKLPGLKDIHYDFKHHGFFDQSGRPVPSGYWTAAARTDFGRAARAGEASLRRGAFLQSLISSEIGKRPELLGEVLARASEIAGGDLRALFSRASRQTGGIGRATAPQRPAAPPPVNPWQRANAKAKEILSPENIDRVIYEMQDKFIDLKRLRDHIKAIGGVITDLNDAYLGEELYHQRLAKRVKNFQGNELKPLLADMRNRGIGVEEFETFLHARHAPEANAEMAKRNPNQGMIDSGRQQAAAAVKALELQLQKAKNKGTATESIEKSLNDARGELANWNKAQAFQGTEEERLSLSGMSDAEAQAIIADKGYDADHFVAKIEATGAKAVIPPRSSRLTQRSFDRHLYQDRNLIERFFARIKHFRRIATRYDKLASSFLSFVHLACAFIWLA